MNMDLYAKLMLAVFVVPGCSFMAWLHWRSEKREKKWQKRDQELEELKMKGS